MRVAVVGGGLFGCTAAIHSARAGHEVHLFEATGGLLQAASGCSYYRLHRGYHYPRSPETGRESREAEPSFREEYGGCIVDGPRQLYMIARDSKVSGAEFKAFMDAEGLPFEELHHETLFEVDEPRIVLSRLRKLVYTKLSEAGVNVHLGTPVPSNAAFRFDQIVVAAYSSTNTVLDQLGFTWRVVSDEYKFQVVEKPIVRLPAEYKKVSVVVLDGPFCCLDPYEDTNLHVLGHVTETIHSETCGSLPVVPLNFVALLNSGIIVNPTHTRFADVIAASKEYFPNLEEAEHVGSTFTVRAVLAHQEATDARPTLVERLDDQVIKVFSGKLGTVVTAAQSVVGIIGRTGRSEFISAAQPWVTLSAS